MRHIVIGNSAAGNAAARSIISTDPSAHVIIFSNEIHPAYFRPLIPDLIDDTIDKETFFHDEQTDPKEVEKRLGQQVERIITETKSIMLKSGERISYDRLLIATGSAANRLPISGMDAGRVYTLRTVDDAQAIQTVSRDIENVVVIGGGRVGMKIAAALKKMGLRITVVEKLDYVVPLQVDEVAGEILNTAVMAQGIDLMLGQSIRSILQTNGRVEGVELEDGRRLPAELVVVATGVTPNTELAERAGIRVNKAVWVDEFMQTNISGVYAAGDVVEFPDIVTNQPVVSGIWTNAVKMGTVAGRNMAGAEMKYEGAFGILNSLELANIPTVSIGLVNPPSTEEYDIIASRRGNLYRKLVLKNGILLGALVLGDIEGTGVYTGLVKRKIPVEAHLDTLMADRPHYAPWMHREPQISL